MGIISYLNTFKSLIWLFLVDKRLINNSYKSLLNTGVIVSSKKFPYYENKNKISYVNKMNEIVSFKEVTIEQGFIVFCDIDDTVLDYGKIIDDYWKLKIHDPSYIIWFELVKNTIPNLTDDYFHEFLKKLEENNCEIHFITHRNTNFKEITDKHLSLHGIKNIQVNHLSGTSKSRYINNNFNLANYNGSIFIDDSFDNNKDVIENVPGCITYRYIKSGIYNTNN